VITKNQEEFLLTFFEKENYANWKNIAVKLIYDGSCIVAGNDPIWRGGIGNFIKISEAKDAVGCSLFEFDLAVFLSSAWFREDWDLRVKELQEIEFYLTFKYLMNYDNQR